jgi:hypothetical protein
MEIMKIAPENKKARPLAALFLGAARDEQR